MRKIITATFITMDGVMQAPGGSQEDTAEGFKYGGWQFGKFDDPISDEIIGGYMNKPFELLLGRITYDIFASYWPTATTENEVAAPFNSTKKFVVSHKPHELTWQNSTLITSDLPDQQAGVVSEIKKLKEMDGPDLWVWGSGNLIQTLLAEDLIDTMHILTYPVTIGSGKRLFQNGTKPKTFKLVESKITTKGVIIATYEPAGELKTDSSLK